MLFFEVSKQVKEVILSPVREIRMLGSNGG